MPNDERIITRLVARVRALLPEDWQGQAGRRFRSGTAAISEFAEKNRISPRDLAEDAIELGRRKIEGSASQEHAEAQKNYAEATKAFTESEDTKLEIELKRRSLESEVSKKEAETREAHAIARLAEIKALEAHFDLNKRLRDEGMVVDRDERGNLTISPTGKELLPRRSNPFNENQDA